MIPALVKRSLNTASPECELTRAWSTFLDEMPGQKISDPKLLFMVDGNTGTQLSEGRRW